jgi:hypothetical protein
MQLTLICPYFIGNLYVIIRNLKLKFLQCPHKSLMLASAIMEDVRNRFLRYTRKDYKKSVVTCKIASWYSKQTLILI